VTVTQLSFSTVGAQLAAELVWPTSVDLTPGVVLLHGAAWGERRFNRVFAKAFADAGIAALNFDRRGTGESTGDPTQDIPTFAADAVAAYEALSSLREIDPGRIGLWGYSNGAWVAALAASRIPKLAFLILTGASAVSPAASEVYRRVQDLRDQGTSEATLAAVRDSWTILFDYMVNGRWHDDWDGELENAAGVIRGDEVLQRLPTPEFVKASPYLDSVPRFDHPLFQDFKTRLKGLNPGMGFDPIPVLEVLECPVLIVLAEADKNLPAKESFRVFEALAARKRAGQIRIEMLPDTDHSFSRGGASDRENPELFSTPRREEDFRKGYLQLMTNWAAENVGVRE
jgi:pimeloyl-ACP methyl ester carboxylesterase